MGTLTKKKGYSCVIAFLTLFCGLVLPSALLAQYDYSEYEEFDPEKRVGLFYASGTALYIQGKGFRDVQISDYERTPMDSNDIQASNVSLSDSNYNDFRAGVSLGFITMENYAWGGGFEVEYIGFQNPIIFQYAAFLNYGVLGGDHFILAPYVKIGRTSSDIILANVQSTDAVRLSEVERLRGVGAAVDVYDGNELKTETEAFYLQFGLQLIYRPRNNIAFYFQLGYQNEIDITKEAKLNVEGRRTNPVTNRQEPASFTLDFDDRAIVEPNTNTPARLNPTLTTGPLYFSMGIGYPFDFD